MFLHCGQKYGWKCEWLDGEERQSSVYSGKFHCNPLTVTLKTLPISQGPWDHLCSLRQLRGFKKNLDGQYVHCVQYVLLWWKDNSLLQYVGYMDKTNSYFFGVTLSLCMQAVLRLPFEPVQMHHIVSRQYCLFQSTGPSSQWYGVTVALLLSKDMKSSLPGLQKH